MVPGEEYAYFGEKSDKKKMKKIAFCIHFSLDILPQHLILLHRKGRKGREEKT